MGLSEAAQLVAIINGQVFHCLVCQGGLFTTRAIKLNTAAFELLDLAWANRSSLGVICHHCGYIHEFLGEAVQLFDQETGARVS